MKELIKITEQNGKKAVSARELHAFLESNRQFTDWIKYRIQQYDFIENIDYVSFSQICQNGGRSIEYALTVNMAKELSMVEGNAKGKQARQYFISCEQKVINQLRQAAVSGARSDFVSLIERFPDVHFTIKGGDLIGFADYLVNKTRRDLEQMITDANSETYPSPDQVAKILNVDKSTLWRWQKKGYLIPLKIGYKSRYKMSDVKRILEGGK